MQSNYFSQRGLKGLNRIGDILLPGDGDLPSFSAYGCLENVDDLVAYAPPEDISLLNTAMAALSFMPASMLRWLVGKMSSVKPEDKGLMAPLYRQLNIGLRGILFSLYYGEKPGKQYQGKDPMAVIGYEINRVE